MSAQNNLVGKPWPDYTPEDVQAGGWLAEARDADGKLVSVIAPNSDDASIGEFIREFRDEGMKITIFPKAD